MNSFLPANDPNTSGKPKAYLNWMLLDNQFNYVSTSSQSGAIPVGSADVLNTLATTFGIHHSGYLYIWVSNETNWDVFFDNLSVATYSGPMLEETHYYPGGLTMFGISDKALKGNYIENKLYYNGKELQNKEFSDGSGLGLYDYGARFYDHQLVVWHVPDPLNEHEYKYSVGKVFNEVLGQEGIEESDEEATSDIRNFTDDYLQVLGPINLTADNSKIHYGESPYAYVMNNPIKYIDPLGLDTTLPTFVKIGYKNSTANTPPWWVGPGLIGLGQPLDFLKPVGALGSETGSSIASRVLSKAIPYSSPLLKQTTRKVVAKVVGKQIAKRVGTAVVGRFLGRLVPYVGWALFAKDLWDYRHEIMEFEHSLQETNKMNAYKADGTWSNEWHVH